jgi:hypothetical protein
MRQRRMIGKTASPGRHCCRVLGYTQVEFQPVHTDGFLVASDLDKEVLGTWLDNLAWTR